MDGMMVSDVRKHMLLDRFDLGSRIFVADLNS
jgi:hypothetical protein